MRELSWGDAVLWMRQLWLYTLAAAARPRRVLFLKEHPRDPQEYKAPSDPVDYPSFYAWPEWEVFRTRFELMEIRVDLGVLGHDRKKPTTLGTNISSLAWLDGLVDRRPREQLMEAQASIQDRTSQSRGLTASRRRSQRASFWSWMASSRGWRRRTKWESPKCQLKSGRLTCCVTTFLFPKSAPRV